MRLCLRRREFVAALAGAVTAWPLSVRAQRADRVRRIGVLLGLTAADPEAQASIAALRRGLREFNWIEGQTVEIEYRFVGGGADATKAAADLVAWPAEGVRAGHTIHLRR